MLVLDGKEIPAPGRIISGLFSPDSQRFAYVMSKPAGDPQGNAAAVRGSSAAGEQFVVVCDQEEGPPLQGIPTLVFSPDSKRIVYYTMARNGRSFVSTPYEDHQPRPEIQSSIRAVMFSPGGEHLVYAHGNGVVFDGTEIAAASEPRFSPDGEHFAYVKTTGGRRGTSSVIADGEEGLAYDGVQALSFTPDGHVMYLAAKDRQSVLVIGSEQSQPFDGVSEVLPSPTGHGFAFVGQRGSERIAVVNGQELPAGHSLAVSADGKRFACVAGQYPDQSVVVVGGPTYALPAMSAVANRDPAVPTASMIALSADGQHVAFISTDPRTQEMTLHLDDRQASLGRMRLISTPAISPDGKYVAFMGHYYGSGQYAMVVNGQAGPAHDWMLLHLDPPAHAPTASVQFGEDGSLQYLAVTGGQLQRVTVNLDAVKAMTPAGAGD